MVTQLFYYKQDIFGWNRMIIFLASFNLSLINYLKRFGSPMGLSFQISQAEFNIVIENNP
uniref:hypothetical protein n=1 Tax=Borreliella yangtzensis TaxID=683292 RepID=UPI003B21FD43